MGKSLTEVAKAVLMNESNDPTPDRDAKLMTPNKGTLRPGAGLMEPSMMGNEAEMIADAPKKPGEGENVGARAAGKQKKDTTVKQSVPAEPAEKLMAEEEEIEEDYLPGINTHRYSSIQRMGDAVGKLGSKNAEKNAIKATSRSSSDQPGILNKLVRIDTTGSSHIKPSGMTGNYDSPGTKRLKEELDEELELSEELEEFIDQCIAEGMSEEEIAEAIEENFELVTEEEELEEDTLDEDSDYEYSVDMSEHVAALFEGEDLSEEFQAKAIAIFEAAVTSTVKSELAAIEEAFASTLEEQVVSIQEELSSNVDDYLNYVVENWVAENEVAIEAGLRTELTEEFISGLRNLFAENYIDIPEDKISVVEELGEKVAELENKLNEEIERNVELTAILSESKKSEILYTVVEGLTTTQAEKLKALAESVDFVTEEEYASKVMTLRESYFPSSIRTQSELDNIEPGMEGKSMISEELQGPMAKYVQVLGKKLPN